MRQTVTGAAFALLLAIPATANANEEGGADLVSASAEPSVQTELSAPPATPGIVDVWMANENATLSDTLASWAHRAGWTLIWETESDFRLAASGSFEGDFQDVAAGLIEAFGRSRPRIRATFYAGNSVLRVFAERAEP